MFWFFLQEKITDIFPNSYIFEPYYFRRYFWHQLQTQLTRVYRYSGTHELIGDTSSQGYKDILVRMNS
jgi:hypothetical protein